MTLPSHKIEALLSKLADLPGWERWTYFSAGGGNSYVQINTGGTILVQLDLPSCDGWEVALKILHDETWPKEEDGDR